ncbi:hypothetical protein BC835DRAFT_586964 [Cytidiella melzeri]|nr:hypothetical protein BC835DRAFT_586964 [Cytidiella melzeri]
MKCRFWYCRVRHASSKPSVKADGILRLIQAMDRGRLSLGYTVRLAAVALLASFSSSSSSACRLCLFGIQRSPSFPSRCALFYPSAMYTRRGYCARTHDYGMNFLRSHLTWSQNLHHLPRSCHPPDSRLQPAAGDIPRSPSHAIGFYVLFGFFSPINVIKPSISYPPMPVNCASNHVLSSAFSTCCW